MRRTVHTAVQDSPHSLSLKRVTPCQSACSVPCARHGNDQRVRDNNWQRMSPPMPLDESTTQRRAARTIAVYIHRPNRTTAVRTARACRRTSLCNSRAHRFAQLPEHRSETSTQLEQELPHHDCTQSIAIARANVTTAPSFYRQNLHDWGSGQAASH